METLVDRIENHFLQYFREKRLTVGDTLPKEVEIARELNVSRHIVREGISRLTAIGAVESRKRRGTVICRPRPFLGFEKMVQAGLHDRQDQQNYLELRVAIELGMCHFIFARKTPEKIAELKKMAIFSTDVIYDHDAELDFHTSLIAIANNDAANDFRRILLMALPGLKNNTRSIPSSHQDICEVLEHGSAEKFYQIMHRHLGGYLPGTPEN